MTTFDRMVGKKETTISVRMDEDILSEIDRRARSYNVSRAQVIRTLLEEGLKAQSKFLPSALSLEKQISAINRKVEKLAETLNDYGRDGPTHKKQGSS